MRRLRISIMLLVSAAVASLVALGGPADEPAATRADVLRPQSLSPYEIARVVNEAADRWDVGRQSVTVDLAETWRRLGVEPAGFETCTADCEAETSRHDLDGEPGKEVVLKLTWGRDLCRYLVFGHDRDDDGTAAVAWRLLGSVDHDFNRYEMSGHRFVETRGGNWLVIRGQAGSGSGFSLYGETWYAVGRREGVRPVLSYFSDGNFFSGPAGLSRSFKTQTLVPDAPPNEPDAVAVRYSISYDAGTGGENSYENVQLTRYVWDALRREFVFARDGSEITPDEVAAVAAAEDPEVNVWVGEVFLKYNLTALLETARGADAGRREWLRLFLAEGRETKESRILSQALREKRTVLPRLPARGSREKINTP